MDIKFGEIFDLAIKFNEDEKKEILKEFSNNFTQAHKLMAWIEDPNVNINERTKYFSSMFCIFDSMLLLIKLLMNSGMTDKQIIEALNDLPF